jgi:hypothetical protein
LRLPWKGRLGRRRRNIVRLEHRDVRRSTNWHIKRLACRNIDRLPLGVPEGQRRLGHLIVVDTGGNERVNCSPIAKTAFKNQLGK